MIRYEANRLILSGKIDLSSVEHFSKQLYDRVKRKCYEDIILDFHDVDSVYPNGIVPIIAIASRYRTSGISFSVNPPRSRAVESAFLFNGWLHTISPEQYAAPTQRLNETAGLKVFRTSDELNPIINAVLDICLQTDVSSKGVLELLEWSLNEVAGNILDHAEVEHGFVQVTHYARKEHLAFVVCDTGIGIPTSMARQFNHLRDDCHAIEHAVQKGVTSKPGVNQGYGLAGALAVAQNARGVCNIISGKARYEVSATEAHNTRYSPPFEGTLVELQFDTSLPLNAKETLFGTEIVSYLESAFEGADQQIYEVRLSQFATSFGNRPTAVKLRTVIENLLKQEFYYKVIVHMDDIRVISSSFADELFGHLFVKLGPIGFMSRIELKGINEFCRKVIDKAIQQRYSEIH